MRLTIISQDQRDKYLGWKYIRINGQTHYFSHFVNGCYVRSLCGLIVATAMLGQSEYMRRCSDCYELSMNMDIDHAKENDI